MGYIKIKNMKIVEELIVYRIINFKIQGIQLRRVKDFILKLFMFSISIKSCLKIPAASLRQSVSWIQKFARAHVH